MDLLLSLPIISYLAGPAVTSWPTSLNLLFFYLTWATLVLSHPPLWIELIGTVAVRIGMWLLPSLALLAFDVCAPALAAPVKLHGASSLPRRNASLLVRQLALALANLLLLTLLQAGVSAGATLVMRRPPFRTSITLPLPWPLAKHMLQLYLARELLTYHVHRHLLHSDGLVARLHRAHGHDHDHGGAPYSLMLYADHPLPLVLHRWLPVYLPCLLLRPHLLTYFLFTMATTVEEMVSMSGYSVVPGLLMGGITRRTGDHYRSAGRGNFSASGILDWIRGTRVLGEDGLASQGAGTAKRRVRKRPAKSVTDSESVGQDGLGGFKKGRKMGGGRKNA